jgi:hypothetical protein
MGDPVQSPARSRAHDCVRFEQTMAHFCDSSVAYLGTVSALSC